MGDRKPIIVKLVYLGDNGFGQSLACCGEGDIIGNISDDSIKAFADLWNLEIIANESKLQRKCPLPRH